MEAVLLTGQGAPSLDSVVELPGGYSTTRRAALKAVALAGGLGSFYVLLTRTKVSPLHFFSGLAEAQTKPCQATGPVLHRLFNTFRCGCMRTFQDAEQMREVLWGMHACMPVSNATFVLCLERCAR